MPILGDSRRVGHNYQVYSKCPECGLERWTTCHASKIRQGTNSHKLCRSCWLTSRKDQLVINPLVHDPGAKRVKVNAANVFKRKTT